MVDRWLGRPALDWAIGAAAIAGVWFAGGRDCHSFMENLDLTSRGALYQTLIGVTGGLLGFFIATVAILLGIDADRPRMKAALADGRRDDVQSFFFAGIRSVAITLLMFVAILVLDRTKTTPRWAESAAVLASILVSLRTARIVWILHQIVTIAGRDIDESDGGDNAK